MLAEGKIIFDGKNSPFIDVRINFNESNIEYVAKIMPDKTNQELYSWLNNSILGGKILSADVYRYMEKYMRTTGDAKDGLYCYNFCLNSNNDYCFYVYYATILSIYYYIRPRLIYTFFYHPK